jgi:hypothetical protein
VHLGKFPTVWRTLFCRRITLIGGCLPLIPRLDKHKYDVITDLISALWRVSLMLALKCTLLNMEILKMIDV